MGASLALFAVGWLLGAQAVALRLGLKGALLLPRRSPAALWPVLAIAALGALIAAALLAATPLAAVGAALLGLLLTTIVTPPLASLAPLEPDLRFLPGTAAPWTSVELPVPGQPDAGALLLSPRPGRESGTCVVVSHGGGNERLYGLWHLLARLLEQGHSVVVAHLAGHGRGGTDVLSAATLRARLAGIVTAARQAAKPRRLFVLGQSMGAATALDALAKGVAANGFIAVSPLTDLRVGASILRELGAMLRLPLYRALRYGTPFELMPAVGPVRRAMFPIRVEPGTWYVAAFKVALTEMALLQHLRNRPRPSPPVLLIHGASDGIVPSRESVRVAEVLGADATMKLYRHLHHLEPLFDDRVLDDIDAWMQTVG